MSKNDEDLQHNLLVSLPLKSKDILKNLETIKNIPNDKSDLLEAHRQNTTLNVLKFSEIIKVATEAVTVAEFPSKEDLQNRLWMLPNDVEGIIYGLRTQSEEVGELIGILQGNLEIINDCAKIIAGIIGAREKEKTEEVNFAQGIGSSSDTKNLLMGHSIKYPFQKHKSSKKNNSFSTNKISATLKRRSVREDTHNLPPKPSVAPALSVQEKELLVTHLVSKAQTGELSKEQTKIAREWLQGDRSTVPPPELLISLPKFYVTSSKNNTTSTTNSVEHAEAIADLVFSDNRNLPNTAQPPRKPPPLPPNTKKIPLTTPRRLSQPPKRGNEVIVAEEFSETILQIFSEFAPEEWGQASQEKRDKIKESISLQLLAYYTTVTSPMPRQSSLTRFQTQNRKQKGASLPYKLINSTILGLDASPRQSLSKNLVDLVFPFVLAVYGVVDGYVAPTVVTLRLNDVRSQLGFLVGEISFHFEHIKNLIEPKLVSDTQTVKEYCNRVMEVAISSINGQVLQLPKEVLDKGQYLKLGKMEILNSINRRNCHLTCAVSTLASFLRVADLDDKGARLAIHAMIGSLVELMTDIMNHVETLHQIESIEELSQIKKSINYSMDMAPGQEKQILDFTEEELKDDKIDPNDRYRPGTVNNIIIRLISQSYDRGLFSAFLAGYDNFCSPSDFWQKLLQCYLAPPGEEGKALLIKQRIAKLVFQWCKNSYYSLSPSLVDEIKYFAQKVLSEDNFGDIGKDIVTVLDEMGKIILEEHKPIPYIPLYGFENIPPHLFTLFADEREIAEQFTIFNLELYQRIEPRELTGVKWTKDKMQIFSHRIVSLLKRANQIGFWVAAQVIYQEKLADRVKVLCKLIGVALRLAELTDYHSLMGVLVGLGLASLSRLKHTFNALPKKSTEDLKKLQEYQEPSGGFRNLRNFIKAGGTILPYLGIHLTDLVAIDENSEHIEIQGQVLVNFIKHHLVNNSISKFLQYQQAIEIEQIPKQEPLFTLLCDLPSVGDKELYNLSLEREPRDCAVKDLV